MNSGLKFLTLNCWGLPFLTPFKNRRLDAIADMVRDGHWDVVALQEVWLKSDQKRIIEKAGFPVSRRLSPTDPAFFGSGGFLMLLSRHKILKEPISKFSWMKGFPAPSS